MTVNFICMEFAGKRCPCRTRVREFAPCVTQPQHHRNKSCNPWYCKTNRGADLIKTWQNPFIWAHLCLVTHCSMHHAALWTNTEGRLWATDGNWGGGGGCSGFSGHPVVFKGWRQLNLTLGIGTRGFKEYKVTMTAEVPWQIVIFQSRLAKI